MEVSHVKDHVTHCVIGGGEDIGFGISNSAEFFNILSSTLYKNQKLAVIREVLCNAWDAHIMVGKQDTPVQITLDREVFIIRDFGPGIEHSQIGPIYAVYGNSTKKHDGKQTGGFGLGCKAPFAYTDHFEVISWHNGVKTVYNMSKASVELGGKPGVKTLGQFPCGSETGIQVKIKLKSPGDIHEFGNIIRRIVANGEMNMELNKDKLKVIPFSHMSMDFLISAKPFNDAQDKILLRYGNVIYPIDGHHEYESEYDRVEELLKKTGGWSRYHDNSPLYLVLQAPPHSISVTPSREELSMQEHTINTLKKLLSAFLSNFDRTYEPEALKIAEQGVQQAWKDEKIDQLLTYDELIPGLGKLQLSDSSEITTMPTLVRHHVSNNYPRHIKNFKKNDMLSRINILIQNNWGNRGLLQSYRTLLRDSMSDHRGDPADNQWFQRHIVWPLVKGMSSDLGVIPDRLFAFGYGIVTTGNYTLSARTGKDIIRSTKGLEAISVLSYRPFLRNIVVLSYTRNDVGDRLAKFPIIKSTGNQNYGVMLYVVPRSNAEKVQQIRDYFAKIQNITVIDLTVAAEWEHKEVAAPVERVYKKRAKQEGWPAVTSILVKVENKVIGMSMDQARAESAKRITSPKWFTWLAKRTKDMDNPQHLPEFTVDNTAEALRYWGDEGAVALTTAQEQKLRAAGAVPMKEYVRAKVVEYVANSNEISMHWAETDWQDVLERSSISSKYERRELVIRAVGHILASRELRKACGIHPKLSQKDMNILNMWNSFTRYHGGYGYPKIDGVDEIMAAKEELKLAPGLAELIAQVKNNDMIHMLDIHRIATFVDTNKHGAAIAQKAMDMFLTALKG